MKRIHATGQIPGPPLREPDVGSALVIVLCLLVLLIVLTIGFLARVSTERGAAASYADAAAARRLADTCVELVKAQIEHASTQNATAWISQPGMTRTLGANGSLETAYKLYSAAAMTSNTTDTLLTEDMPPSEWAGLPAGWTDLNAPVLSGNDTFFPILNPHAMTRIPGFAVSDPPDWLSSGTLPLPVRWLYVLAGGEIIAPASTNATTAVFSGPSAPTEANPIVGRIAFWTDDESCKVNVNTAGAPTFFDLPWYNSNQERALADTQPVRNEFQRYPGHPATVDLASIIAPLLPGLTPREVRAEVLDLAPRLQEGGSLYGTTSTRSNNSTSAITLDTDRLYASSDELWYSAETPPDDFRIRRTRLGAPELDLLKFFLTAHSRAPELNPFGLPKVAMWPLHVAGASDPSYRTPYEQLIARAASINDKPYYFQRADSRDPDSDWDDIERNKQLFAYLDSLFSTPLPGVGSSLGSKFGTDQKQILTEILDYIRCTNLHDEYLPAVANRFTRPKDSMGAPEIGHGFVAPLRVKSGSDEYLGFGRFYTLSELAFHFICNADGYDVNNDGVDSDGDGEDKDVADPDPYPWAGGTLSTPAVRLPYENYERRRSRYGPGYVGVRDPATAPDNAAVPPGAMLGPNERRVQMMILPELFSAMYGYGILRPDMSVKISGLETITLNGTPIFPRDSETVEITSSYRDLKNSWPMGGSNGFRQALVSKGIPARGVIPADPESADASHSYPLVSIPVTITGPPGSATMEFSTGQLTVELYYGTGADAKLAQRIEIGGHSPTTIPAPNLVAFPDHFRETAAESWWGFHSAGVVGGKPGRMYWVGNTGKDLNSDNYNVAGMIVRGHGDPANTGAAASASGTYAKNTDVIRSFAPSHGDFRLIAARPHVTVGAFAPLGDWSSGNFLQHTLHEADWHAKRVPGAIDSFGHYRSGIVSYGKPDTLERKARTPDFPASAPKSPNLSGDYDKGLTFAIDGPYVNKPDEGNTYATGTNIPYFPPSSPGNHAFDGSRFFSPNRIIPSPGMLGSLPTHVVRNEPWRTLLFRHQENHPNWADPKDHWVMEFFWMPVVEPYAISEPFSSAGKVNMNYQIMPFTWIERSTALRAALSEERVTAAPLEASQYYNLPDSDKTPEQQNYEFRKKIDAAQTLEQFQDRFDHGRVFQSASEICDLYLFPVPEGQTLGTMDQFWRDHALTSDNVRERVYTTLYPKLTVRSNIYTVHHRVQALKKRPGSDPASWNESLDRVVGEYRGSTTIERHLNPDDPAIPDYPSSADPTQQRPATEFYRWRTIRNLPFSP